MNIKTGVVSTYFDGTNEYLTIPSSDFLQNLERTDTFSISAWVYPISPSLTPIITKWDSATPKGWFFMALGYNAVSSFSGTLALQLRPHSSAYLYTYSNDSVIFNDWNHVLVTSDGTGTKAGTTFYINGVDAGSQVGGNDNLTTGTIVTANPVEVGRNLDTGWYGNGKIAQLAYFNEELTSVNVTTIYNRGKENPNYSDFSSLMGHYRFKSLAPMDLVDGQDGSSSNMDSTNIKYD